MKTFYLIVVCFLSFSHMFGRIKNGYESGLTNSQASLLRLNAILAEDKSLSTTKRMVVKSRIETLITYIACYQLTNELIRRFEQMSPGVFAELDNITDRRGRPTDVYVKLVPPEKSRLPIPAATFVAPSMTDEDANHSEHGEYSVAVDVWINDNALFLLSHELGHVKYIIPHLAMYAKFYEMHYRHSNVSDGAVGHRAGDQSGQCASMYEKKFMQERRIYFENGGEKPVSWIMLYARSKRSIRGNTKPDAIAFAKSYPEN